MKHDAQGDDWISASEIIIGAKPDNQSATAGSIKELKEAGGVGSSNGIENCQMIEDGKRMKLQLVSHCWRYARLLTYQLSSLLLYPPRDLDVEMVVFCAHPENDRRTWETLDFFSREPCPETVSFRWWRQSTPELMNRGFGRNLASRQSTTDWIWFADCDLTFGEGTLDALADRLRETPADLVYPRSVFIHANHALGDRAIARADRPQVVDIIREEFVAKRYRRAIGGVQIVRGPTARRVGYCYSTRGLQRIDSFRFSDDVLFRRRLKTKGTAIDVPNVFRIRHSDSGRNNPDVSL